MKVFLDKFTREGKKRMNGKMTRKLCWWIGVPCLYLLISAFSAFAQDPLPSWNEGQTKQQILDFVTDVTTASSPNFVPA